MDDQNTDFALLSAEHLAALTESQKEIFRQLDKQDRQFFAKNFSPASLGKALERKQETMQSRAHLDALDQRVKEKLAANKAQKLSQPDSTGQGIGLGEVAAGAAGVAGVVGIGVLAKKIAPDGKAAWRGVKPSDLVEPLVNIFARQEKTDIRFQPPTAEGMQQATVLLRTKDGAAPGLTIVLTPLQETTQVQISKISSESVMEAIKGGSQKLVDLVQDGLRLGKKQGGLGNLADLAGQMVGQGVDIAKTVKDLNLEDQAWEAIRQTADPLQAIYDEKMAIAREQRLKLAMAWDDYYSCPKCRVEFGAGDLECRVCGTARPAQPEQADSRQP